MKKFIVRFIREEEGQDVIEYALLGAFISIVAIVPSPRSAQDVDRIFGEFPPHWASQLPLPEQAAPPGAPASTSAHSRH